RVDETFPKLSLDWSASTASERATLDLYEEVRSARTADAIRLACEQFSGGTVQAGSVWDAVHLAAVELSARFDTREGLRGWPVQPVPPTTSLLFAFRAAGDGPTRRLTLPQAVGGVAEKMPGLSLKKGRLRDRRTTTLDPAEAPADPSAAVDHVFGLLPAKTDD